MNRTKIEWVVNPDGKQGYTWNPVTGCKHGCGYCYARRISRTGFEPKFHKSRLSQPAEIKTPSTFFVGSMADLFGEWVPIEWIDSILEIVEKCPQHKFLFLTKNPIRYLEFKFPDNCWLGTTVTKNGDLVYRMGKDNCFLSFEPLLGNIEKPNFCYTNWIIIGSLNSSNKPVPASRGGTRREWVTALTEEARGIPVFIKDSLYELYPDLPRLRGLPYLQS